MNRAAEYWVTLVAAAIVCADIIGYFFPSSGTWGFHFLSFLPPLYSISYLALAVLLFIILRSERTETLIGRIATFADQRPLLFLTICSVFFAGAAVIFRQRVYLHGDGFVFMKNFENAFLGIHPLQTGYAPLAVQYYYALMKLFGMHAYPEMMIPLRSGEILLGVGVLCTTFVTVRAMWDQPKTRLTAFVILSSMPYMELFFGYPETYAVTLFCISVFLMVTTLYLTGRLRFEFVPAAYVLLFFSHYLTICILPAVLYLAFHEVRQRGWTRLMTASAAGVAVSVLVMYSLGIHLGEILPSGVNRPHVLTLTSTNDGFQAYPLFSPYHGLDLLNSVLLESSMVLIALCLLIASRRGTLFGTPHTVFLAIVVASFLIMFFMLKFDLGMARDWDVTAPYIFLCSVFVLAHLTRLAVSGRALTLLAGAVAMHSLLWFTFNATTNPAIARAQVLMDRRYLSYEGAYESSFHLSMAHKMSGDTAASAALWQEYLSNHPEDVRAYPQLIGALTEAHTASPDEIMLLYDQWLARDPNTERVKYNYSQFCLDAGTFCYRNNAIDQAERLYRKILELFPGSAVAHNNLGTVHEKRGEFEQALESYRKAIECDSLFGDSYWNLGRLYHRLGREQESVEVAILAARHGDTSAQEELTRQGIRWK